MATISTPNTQAGDSINVFLLGNNPIELSNIYEKLKSIRTRKFNAEIGFDLKDAYKRIMKFKPMCILIDDNLEALYLKSLIKKLSSRDNTKDIPITIIKNSNYRDTYLAEAQDFILKDGITEETLSRSILNAIKWKPMSRYVYKSYKKSRSHFLDLFSKN